MPVRDRVVCRLDGGVATDQAATSGGVAGGDGRRRGRFSSAAIEHVAAAQEIEWKKVKKNKSQIK